MALLAVVVDTFPCWSERFIARELGEFARRGIDFTVFALNKGSLPPGPDPEWNGLLGRVRALPPVRSAQTISAALAAMPELRKARTRGIFRSVQKALGPAGVLRGARAHVLCGWLREGGFAHVHAHFANWPSTLAWIAARQTGIPFSASFHARDFFVEAQLVKEKVHDARAVFACHGQVYEQLRGMAGREASKVVWMPHGLPLDDFPFRATRRTTGRKRTGTLLAAGRFVSKKGFADLLDALQLPVLRKGSVSVALVGDGPDRSTLHRVIAQRGLDSRVQLRPAESGPHLRELLSSCAAFVAPHRPTKEGDRDGIPNVVLEAMALGAPVIGTDAGGLPEILNDSTGYVARSGDPASLAEAIVRCLENPKIAAQKARAARTIIEERHDIRKSIEPLVKVIS